MNFICQGHDDIRGTDVVLWIVFTLLLIILLAVAIHHIKIRAEYLELTKTMREMNINRQAQDNVDELTD